MFWMCARPSETVPGDEQLFLAQLLKGGINLTGCPSPSHCGGAARLNFRRRQERWGLLPSEVGGASPSPRKLRPQGTGLAPGGSAGWVRGGTRILFFRGLLRPGIFPPCSLQLQSLLFPSRMGTTAFDLHFLHGMVALGLSWWLSSKESACNAGDASRHRFDPWVGKISWRREGLPTPVLLPEKFQGQRSLAGYSPWGRKRVPHNLATQHQHCGSYSRQGARRHTDPPILACCCCC